MIPTDPIQTAPLQTAATRVVSPSRSVYVDLRGQDPFRPRTHIRVASWHALRKSLTASLRFLTETEVHVYAFAVSVNILISFYPFVVAMILICRHVFHWQAAANVIIQTVKDYFPADFGLDMSGFLRMSSVKSFSFLSIFLLFFTANGIFTPLEVAFNRIWGAKQNRSFLWNQVISLGLIFVCGALVLMSACLGTLNSEFLGSTFGANDFASTAQSVVLHVIALPVTIVMIFLIYWLLPNAKIPVGRLLPSSIAVAVLLQVSEFVNILLWPWLRDKLRADVPPFVQSISIIFWAFITTIIILAGAEWAARVKVDGDDAEPTATLPDLH
jgi:membrane protein